MGSMIDSLSKEDRKRHFPEGGKGDCIFRGRLGKELNNEKQKNYKSNSFWDNCEFETKRKAKLNVE